MVIMTPAVTMLEAARISFSINEYDRHLSNDGDLRDFGQEAAEALGLSAHEVLQDTCCRQRVRRIDRRRSPGELPIVDEAGRSGCGRQEGINVSAVGRRTVIGICRRRHQPSSANGVSSERSSTSRPTCSTRSTSAEGAEDLISGWHPPTSPKCSTPRSLRSQHDRSARWVTHQSFNSRHAGTRCRCE